MTRRFCVCGRFVRSGRARARSMDARETSTVGDRGARIGEGVDRRSIARRAREDERRGEKRRRVIDRARLNFNDRHRTRHGARRRDAREMRSSGARDAVARRRRSRDARDGRRGERDGGRARAVGRDAERGGGRGAAAFARRVRALPVGPCPLAPLAICEKLNYVAVEEERAAKDAAEACARLPTGRRLLCAATRSAAATLSRAVNWGETAFAREVRIVPLPGKRGGSRAPSFDHALTALCDLRMNKLCGDVVDQRFEHAAKQAELKHECDIAESLSERWETAKEMCEAKATEIKLEKEAMDRELRELEDDYARKFGGAKADLKTLKKMSKGKTPPSLNCRSKEYGDKPDNDDMIIASLRQTREKLVQTRARTAVTATRKPWIAS